MLCAGVYDRRQSQLLDTGQTLQKGMPYNVVQQPLRYVNEPEHRVVDDFSCLHLLSLLVINGWWFVGVFLDMNSLPVNHRSLIINHFLQLFSHLCLYFLSGFT